MAHPFYDIVALPDRPKSPREWRLYNKASGEYAGSRLRKGETGNHPWPFKSGSNWTVYTDREEAHTAANKLQKYLEAYEAGRSKSKSTVSSSKLTFD